MCLISAEIAVEEGTAGKLAARPDFDRDSDEPDRVTWWGALIPDGQREAMMAEAMAQLRAQGHKDVEAPAGPQRWVRGVLRVRGREITVEVNSQQRLARLLDILRKVGGNPVVTSEKRIDRRTTAWVLYVRDTAFESRDAGSWGSTRFRGRRRGSCRSACRSGRTARLRGRRP